VKPFVTLVDLDGMPSSVCADAKGDVYLPHGSAQTISVFSRGSIWPTSTLTDANAKGFGYCTFDAGGDLFVTYDNGMGQSAVDEFAAGSTKPATLISNLPETLGGLARDQSGNLYLSNQSRLTIDIYVPPYGGPPQSSFGVSNAAFQIVLDAPQTHLWSAANLLVTEYLLPAGTVTKSLSAGSGRGVALSPAGKR
jgi:hypothetical protein